MALVDWTSVGAGTHTIGSGIATLNGNVDAYYNGGNFTDVEIFTRFKTSTVDGQLTGHVRGQRIWLRADDTFQNGYYLDRYNFNSFSNSGLVFSVTKRVAGINTQLSPYQQHIGTNKFAWYWLRFRIDGGKITVEASLDDVTYSEVIALIDPAPIASGRVAIGNNSSGSPKLSVSLYDFVDIFTP